MNENNEHAEDESDTELDLLRKDLVHQIHMPDDLDLDYLLEVTIRAKIAADKEGRNMTERNRTLDEIIADAKSW